MSSESYHSSVPVKSEFGAPTRTSADGNDRITTPTNNRPSSSGGPPPSASYNSAAPHAPSRSYPSQSNSYHGSHSSNSQYERGSRGERAPLPPRVKEEDSYQSRPPYHSGQPNGGHNYPNGSNLHNSLLSVTQSHGNKHPPSSVDNKPLSASHTSHNSQTHSSSSHHSSHRPPPSSRDSRTPNSDDRHYDVNNNNNNNNVNNNSATNQRSANSTASPSATTNKRAIWGSRRVDIFDKIEQIGEGTYGYVVHSHLRVLPYQHVLRVFAAQQADSCAFKQSVYGTE